MEEMRDIVLVMLQCVAFFTKKGVDSGWNNTHCLDLRRRDTTPLVTSCWDGDKQFDVELVSDVQSVVLMMSNFVKSSRARTPHSKKI